MAGKRCGDGGEGKGSACSDADPRCNRSVSCLVAHAYREMGVRGRVFLHEQSWVAEGDDCAPDVSVHGGMADRWGGGRVRNRWACQAARARAEEESSRSMVDARLPVCLESGVLTASCGGRWSASPLHACMHACMPAWTPAGQASVAKDPENLAVSWCVCPWSLAGSGKIWRRDGWLDGRRSPPIALEDGFDVVFEIVPVLCTARFACES
jgi:hypothetical protein